MNIVFFSSLPPPIGGVTKSVENLLLSLDDKPINTDIVRNYFTWKPLFRRYDIAHVHYTKSWKRLFGLLIGKLIAKKVIFTLHSNDYADDMMNRISARLADAVILLNKNAENKYKSIFKKTAILSSMFSEGMKMTLESDKKYIQRIDDKIYLLVYVFDKTYRDSKDVYGIDFILENLWRLGNEYIIVLVDIKGAYREDIDKIDTKKLIYLGHEVNFISLLNEIDIYVRPTSTDGASVAVQEALLLGKNVLASDCVERPNEVVSYKYGNFIDFNNKLNNLNNRKMNFVPNSVDKYIDFCKKLIE